MQSKLSAIFWVSLALKLNLELVIARSAVNCTWFLKEDEKRWRDHTTLKIKWSTALSTSFE